MATFRPYTSDEIRDAAEAYGVDPNFALAVYEVESSNGTNPKAMKARAVKRKRDTTFVRGPFQLEDDTTSDLIRENKLGNINIDDPDTHLDLAMRQMRKLADRYKGDPIMMSKAYLGFGTDELGTTSEGYSNKIYAAMQRLQGGASPASIPTLAALTAEDVTGLGALAPMPEEAEALTGEWMPANDAFGIPEMAAPRRGVERDPLGLPMFLSGGRNSATDVDVNDDNQLRQFVESLVDEELSGKAFANA